MIPKQSKNGEKTKEMSSELVGVSSSRKPYHLIYPAGQQASAQLKELMLEHSCGGGKWYGHLHSEILLTVATQARLLEARPGQRSVEDHRPLRRPRFTESCWSVLRKGGDYRE